MSWLSGILGSSLWTNFATLNNEAFAEFLSPRPRLCWVLTNRRITRLNDSRIMGLDRATPWELTPIPRSGRSKHLHPQGKPGPKYNT